MVLEIAFEFLLIIIVITIGVSIIIIRKLVFVNKLLKLALDKKQSQATLMGRNNALGDIHQYIGEFAILSEYDEVITLSTPSKQPSLDIIGIKEDRMDFIEFKKKGARITAPENKIRRIVEAEEKNINYIVKDVNIPDGVSVVTRELRPPSKRNCLNGI